MNIKVVLWLFFIITCSVIFTLSHQTATVSERLSKNITTKIIETSPKTNKLTKNQKRNELNEKEGIVRNYAHFGWFLILGVATFLLMKSYKLRFIYIVALIFCVLYALSDEYHQTFIAGRGFQMSDLYLDWLGSLIGIILIALALKVPTIFKKNITKQAIS